MEEGLTVHHIRIRTPVRRFGVPAWLTKRAYERLFARSPKPAIMHIHVRTEATATATSLAAAMGVPVIVTEHNSFYHLGIRALPPDEQARERAAIRRWFADANIKKVMPVSNDLARVLVDEFGVDHSRIEVVPNVAADVFLPAMHPSGMPFRILLASVWRPPKDHDVFIKALSMLTPSLRTRVLVEWAGFGPDMERIQQRCREELPDVEIRFTGAMTKAELARSMQAADLFVLPTKADNLPCVVLESHCCGTPVVSMRVNGVPEMIDATNGLLVPPSSPEELASALTRCITGEVRFDREAIARAAAQRYSMAAVADRLERIQQEVLGQESH